MTDGVAFLRYLAAECRRVVTRSQDPEMISELKEIADALTARADEIAPSEAGVGMNDSKKPPNCPKCREPMTLAYMIPKAGREPKLLNFECRACRERHIEAAHD
jgi:hypothetical protein